MTEKLRVGILGGTGMVGQRFIALLENHPWFEVTTIAANAFTGNKKMKKITVGKNIDTIGKNAFKNCKNPSPQKRVKQKGQSKSNLSKSSGN